jgi:hypothetical protein
MNISQCLELTCSGEDFWYKAKGKVRSSFYLLPYTFSYFLPCKLFLLCY